MTDKIILDLCGGTGNWSRPYKEAGYKVRVLTLPECDILQTTYEHDYIHFKSPGGIQVDVFDPSDVYGILAAPPCTMFSDARTNAKKPRDLESAMALVNKCLEIIQYCMYFTKDDQQKYSPVKFWALENPWYGRLKWFLGHPLYEFSPWEFGDAYKKRTALWGYFNLPKKTHAQASEVMTKEQLEKHKTNSQQLPKFDYMRSKDIHPEHFGKFDRQTRRAITPAGFAEAFFKANK